MGPQAPSPVPQRRSKRSRPSKRARTSGPGESSSSRPQWSPSPAVEASSWPHLSPDSRIRRPLFTGTPIQGNVDLRSTDFHGESFYDVPTLTADALVQRLHETDHVLLHAVVHDIASILLSLGGASVLPLHDFLGSTESAGAPIHGSTSSSRHFSCIGLASRVGRFLRISRLASAIAEEDGPLSG